MLILDIFFSDSTNMNEEISAKIVGENFAASAVTLNQLYSI